MEKSLQIAVLSACRTKVAVKITGCLNWRFQKIAVEIAVKLASVNGPLGRATETHLKECF